MDCIVYKSDSPVYDANYKEMKYASTTPTETSSKLIIVRPRYRGYNATEELPEGWDSLQDITVCIPTSILLEARAGPDADIVKITESGHQFEGRKYRVVSMDRRQILGVKQNKFFLKALTRDDAY